MQTFFDLEGNVYFSNNLTSNNIEAEYKAGDQINGNRVVMLNNNTVIHADPLDENNYNKIIGFSKNASLIDESVKVIIAGNLEGFGGLVPNSTYYADSNGLITPILPISGIVIEVGTALTSSVLNVRINHEFITI